MGDRLRSQLLQLDNASYKAYKGLRGNYQFNRFILVIDRIQGASFGVINQRVPILSSIDPSRGHREVKQQF